MNAQPWHIARRYNHTFSLTAWLLIPTIHCPCGYITPLYVPYAPCAKVEICRACRSWHSVLFVP